MDFDSLALLFPATQIVLINLLLAGDNALVIVLLCRNLPDSQRKWAMGCAMAGAIGLRLVLMGFALELLSVPFLKLLSAGLLIWMGIQMIAPESLDDRPEEEGDQLWPVISKVMVADFVMSVDHVLAIAAAAQGAEHHHHAALALFGVLLSVPVILFGSKWMLQIASRWPLVIVLTALLLGWVAGQMVYTDQGLEGMSPRHTAWMAAYGVAGSCIVWLAAYIMQKRQDLAASGKNSRS